MRVLCFGDLHGRIRAMYDYARRCERESGETVDVILQVGDFGVFPDTSKLDEKKVGKYGFGDYADLVEQGWKAPIPTYFCKGNNEDFSALGGPLLGNLNYVPDGETVTLGSTRIAFLGGGWAPKSFAADEGKPNHISRRAVERLRHGEFDILVCHEAPAGTRFPGNVYAVGAPPIRELIVEREPRLVVHGHHHIRAERTIGSTRVVCLDLLRPDSPESAVLSIEL